MKDLKRHIRSLVVILLTVFIAVSCDSTSPLGPDKPEPKPEKSSITVEVIDDNTGDYLADATLYEDSSRVDSAKFEDGVYRDTRPQEDKEIGFYAEADGYQKMSAERIGNLKSDINITIRLQQKEDHPEPEGPGSLELIERTCSDAGESNGSLKVQIKNTVESISLKQDGEILQEKEPNEDGIVIFDGLSSGDYTIATEKNGQPVSINEVVIPCDQPQPPTARFSAEADGLTVTYDGSNSSTPNEKIKEWRWDFTNDGDIDTVTTDPTVKHTFKEEQAGTQNSWLQVEDDLGLTDETTNHVHPEKPEEEPEGPGEISISANKCTDGDNPTRTVTIEIENGASWVAFTQNGDPISSLTKEGLTPEAGQIVTFKDVPAGSYTIVAKDNGKKSTLDLTTKECEEPNNPPEAAYNYEITGEDGKTVKFTNTSSDPDGDELANDWDFNGEGDSEEEHPTFTFDDYGTKTVPLTVTDPHGASDAISKDIVLEEPAPTPPPSCPLTSGTVVHFDDNRLRSDKKAEARTQAANVNLSAGEYRVKLYGYDQHDDRAGQNQTDESYYVSLMQDGQEVAQTDELGDLPDGNDLGERTTTIDGVILESDVNKVQGIHAAYPSGSANSLNAKCASFQRVGDVPLSNEYTHEIEVIAEKKIWVSGDQNRLEDTFVSHGEVEPIRTGKDPYGTVKVEARFKLDEDQIDTEHFALEIYFNQDGSDAFRTPIYLDQSGVDGWTTGTVELDAKHFEGHAEDLAGIRIVHGDKLNNDKPSGPDDIIFATGNDNGLLKLYWRTVDDGKSKMLKYNFGSKAYQN